MTGARIHPRRRDAAPENSGPEGGGRSPDRQSRDEQDRELIRRLRAGDRLAGDQLVRRYQDRALRIALRMCDGDRDAALEQVQEAFVKVLRGLDGFDERSRFYTWFYRILVNTCLDARRRQRRWRRLFGWLKPAPDRSETPTVEDFADPVPSHNPHSRSVAGQLERDVVRAMKKMSEKQRMVLTLKMAEGMRIPEIAQVMGLAEGTVKSHLFRATRAMRADLAQWAEQEE